MRIRSIVIITFIFMWAIMAKASTPESFTVKGTGDFLPQNFYKHFTGIVKKGAPGSGATASFPIHMNLRRIGNKLTGGYYYENSSEYLSLSGEIDNKGSFDLNDYDANFFIKGTFVGLFLTQGSVKGTWTNSDTNEEFAFELKENYDNSVKFKSYALNDKYHIRNKKDLPFISVDLNYLHIDSDVPDGSVMYQVMGILEKQFFGDYAQFNNPQKNVTNKRNDAFHDYKNYIEKAYKNDPDKRDVYIWKMSYSADVIYNENNLLTTMVHVEEDIGGVAGFGGLSYSVIDVTTGKKIIPEDIFVSSFDVILNAKLIEKVKVWHDYESTDEMIKAGFEMELIVPNENIYLDHSGLGFYYNAYEIFELETRAYFTFDEIKNILKPDSPISHLFNK